MTTFLNTIEGILATNVGTIHLGVLLKTYGADIYIIRNKPIVTGGSGAATFYNIDAEDERTQGIYGTYSGYTDPAKALEIGTVDIDVTEDEKFTSRVIFGANTYVPSDGYDVTGIEGIYVYTDDTRIIPGDRFNVIRTDGKVKNYKVVQQEEVGMTTTIIRKFLVSGFTI